MKLIELTIQEVMKRPGLYFYDSKNSVGVPCPPYFKEDGKIYFKGNGGVMNNIFSPLHKVYILKRHLYKYECKLKDIL